MPLKSSHTPPFRFISAVPPPADIVPWFLHASEVSACPLRHEAAGY
jgi:hypothetical protein